MKKMILFSCLLMILLMTPLAYADTARAGSFAAGFEGVYGLGDISSGTTVEVTSVGAAVTTSRSRAIGNTGFSVSADTQIYTGACWVQSITITGESAGDWVAIYDDTSATVANLKFDPRIAANTSSFTLDAAGAPFSTGIYANVLDNQVFATVVYDY